MRSLTAERWLLSSPKVVARCTYLRAYVYRHKTHVIARRDYKGGEMQKGLLI